MVEHDSQLEHSFRIALPCSQPIVDMNSNKKKSTITTAFTLNVYDWLQSTIAANMTTVPELHERCEIGTQVFCPYARATSDALFGPFIRRICQDRICRRCRDQFRRLSACAHLYRDEASGRCTHLLKHRKHLRIRRAVHEGPQGPITARSLQGPAVWSTIVLCCEFSSCCGLTANGLDRWPVPV